MTAESGWSVEGARIPPAVQWAAKWSVVIGVASLAVAATSVLWIENGFRHLLFAYLLNFCFFLSIGLGALFFVLLHHLTVASWSVVLRRLAEIMAAALPWFTLLLLPVVGLLLLGDARLYPWNNPEELQHDELLRGKAPYLNASFFAVRFLIYAGVWGLLARFFWRRSLQQDGTGDPELTLQMRKWSGPAMMLFALSVCFAAFDWLMSLDPHWFSTIYGVYFFSGSVVGFFATIILAAIGLQRWGLLDDSVTTEHYHDLGKLLFGFVFFWGYIAFSQYLLIWYANIPEETGWYLVRQQGSWRVVSLLLVFGHLLLPFLGLLPRWAKRSKTSLAFWSVLLLVMHWVDLYWLAMPQLSAERLPIGPMEVLCFLGLGALFTSICLRLARGIALIPQQDPALGESLAFENV